MSGPQKFRKKPVVIEAMEWDGDVRHKHPVMRWILDNGGRADYTPSLRINDIVGQRLRIQTLEGGMIAEAGDFIIRGVNGEFYPCKPDIFAKTYEAAE